jgi:hypothetical protein
MCGWNVNVYVERYVDFAMVLEGTHKELMGNFSI